MSHHTFKTLTGGMATVLASSPEALRAAAEDLEARANEYMRRAENYHHEANRWAEKIEADKVKASIQRRERAARTRAHNADPFGFKERGL